MSRRLAPWLSLPWTLSCRTSLRVLIPSGSLSPRVLPTASPKFRTAISDNRGDANGISCEWKAGIVRREGDARPGRTPMNHCSSWKSHRKAWFRSTRRDRGVRTFHNPHDNGKHDDVKHEEEEEEDEEDSSFESWLQRNPLPSPRRSSSQLAQPHPSLPYSSTDGTVRNKEGSRIVAQHPNSQLP
ncbi:hypothetical protein Vretifemale_15725, partial [Volvox reticuliferus]